MRDFHKYEFELMPFTTMLGERYNNYWLQAMKHKHTGGVVDVLLDEAGMLVTEPDDITDKIRENYYVDGDHAKVIPIKIQGHKCLVIKFPTIIIL